MSVFSAFPQCAIEIYSYEGGIYKLENAAVLGCQVGKGIGGSGGFSIELAPNDIGTTGSDVLDWVSVITPMSLVIIGMQRYSYAQILMVGVVSSCTETQSWSNGGVSRIIEVTGQDFTHFFNSFNWNVTSFQAITSTSALGVGLTGNADTGVLSLGQGLLGGSSSQDSNPAVIGQNWFSTVMAGTKGILAKTSLPYQDGRISFNNAMTTIFERFPNVFIPYYDNFLSSTGSWTSKFRSIFPWPWYEFFVITAPAGFYGLPSQHGRPFSMEALPAAQPVSPTLVARVNPHPILTAKATGAGLPFNLGEIDSMAWNALPMFMLDNHGFFSSSVTFSTGDVRNMYQINPLISRALFGGSNSNVNIFFYTAAGVCDVGSIHRFGYRPEITATEWCADPTGSAGANAGLDVPQTFATLLCRPVSHYQPSHLMANATTTIPLRPDIMPGTRYQYSPFRGDEPWTFYVEGVDHSFVFGGSSTTRLTLTRGLPNSVYADMSKTGLFYGALTGLVERIDGEYTLQTAIANQVGVTVFGAQPAQLSALLGAIAGAYVTAQTT